MNINDISRYRCPGCTGRLITEIIEDRNNEIWKANMWCQGCNKYYYIIDGKVNLTPV